jgi:uncharacterized membrane protein YesL
MEPTIITPLDLQAAYVSGMWHGGLGVGLIIFGIIGWPATRFVLGVIFKPFTKKEPRVPVGSKFWSNYGQKNWKPEYEFSDTSPYGRKK